MTTRFASFNVENLFARPRALNQETWEQGEPILEAFAEVSKLIERVLYSPADKARMIELWVLLEIYRVVNGIVRRNRTPTPRWAWLRANCGSFDVEREATGIEIVAAAGLGATAPFDLKTFAFPANLRSMVEAEMESNDCFWSPLR